jgi:fructuronate reductase
MSRLDDSTLAQAPASVRRPRFDRGASGVGIVHLGLGAFARAHEAIYTDDALEARDGNWAIAGVSLRSVDVRDRLAPQNGLYTAIERSPAGVHRRIVGSVREALFLGDARARIHALLVAPQTHIVTLTVTEKGYCHDPATGRLNLRHPEIAHDLLHPDAPVSAVGLLVWALERRRATHGAPLTIVCCDNLQQNGALLEGLVVNLASERDADLASWIGENAAFPCTMIDRIVPATTAQDIAQNDASLGLSDHAPVVHEPFAQWVIEDRFATPRPAWEAGGAQFVRDVAPFENMKLRLLNASHSAFAYLGFLAGCEYIYQVAARPHFVAYMRRLMEEATPTLHVPHGIDLAAYRGALLTRFANPALPHRTQQIAMDGSQKLPQRILGTVRDNLAEGRPIAMAALAVAGWMRYVSGVDEAGRPIEVSDPLAARFADIAQACRGDAAALAAQLLGVTEIFDEDLHNEPRFAEPVKRWLARLYASGADATVAAAASETTR